MFAQSCDRSEPKDSRTASDSFSVWVEKLPRAGETRLIESDVGCITEGCLLRAFERSRRKEQALVLATMNTVDDLWPASHRVLTYCVATGGFTTSQNSSIDSALVAASDDWGQSVHAYIRRVPSQDGSGCTNSNQTVDFNVTHFSPTDDTSAIGYYPTDSRADRALLLTDSAFTGTGGGTNFQQVVTHEFGHMLGFRHEFPWAPDGGCGAVPEPKSNIETDGGILGGRQLTAFDEMSVMNYIVCKTSANSSSGYHISAFDRAGAMSVYGPSAAIQSAVNLNLQ
jgi:hypothetical protein